METGAHIGAPAGAVFVIPQGHGQASIPKKPQPPVPSGGAHTAVQPPDLIPPIDLREQVGGSGALRLSGHRSHRRHSLKNTPRGAWNIKL